MKKNTEQSDEQIMTAMGKLVEHYCETELDGSKHLGTTSHTLHSCGLVIIFEYDRVKECITLERLFDEDEYIDINSEIQ